MKRYARSRLYDTTNGREHSRRPHGQVAPVRAHLASGLQALDAQRTRAETECPLEALSEDARDQLCLALRAAAVLTYAAQAEPLPFIADDLRVHFADTRAAAAIVLLLSFGTARKSFSHHDHLVALAERQEGVAAQTLPAVTVRFEPALADPNASSRL